ncbi:MAG TPA: AMP-binding protein [Blastocatellia bacterium]|nr:AMP-binding protein [Blastocatellia bacterium]
MSQQTLIRYIERFHSAGSETAFVHRRGYRTTRWSYLQIAQRAFQFARELEAGGIGRGDRVMLWAENSPEWVIAFLGCVLRGIAVVPMDHIATREFALRVYEQVDSRLMVCSREHLEDIAAGFAEPHGISSLQDSEVQQGHTAATSRQPHGFLAPAAFPQRSIKTLVLEVLSETVAKHSSAPYTPPLLEPADPVEIVFTSGTTAEPKGVVISHRNVLASLEPIEREIQKYLKYERIFHPVRFLDLLPLSHVFGQFLGIFIPPLIRGTVIFQDAISPGEVIQTIKRERVSVLVTVPRLLAALEDKLERDVEAQGQARRFREEIESAEGEHFFKRWWRFRRFHRMFGWKFWAFVSGGATLDLDIELFWSRLGFAVVQGYGLTETTSLISVSHPFKLRRGSIGKVLPGSSIKLDEDGEILVRGENIASAYWQGRSLSPVTECEGWFRTGDIGEVDGEGNVFFKGRKKNVIVTSAGMNVYPQDLEAALRKQPDVVDCVVVPVERNGSIEPCGVLILRGGDPATVVRSANEMLADYQHMNSWYVWPEQDFPRTSTDKPRTGEILAVVQGIRTPGPAVGSARQGGLAELIGHITGRATSELGPESSLSAGLNLSSIDRVELLSAREDRYQVELNESSFTVRRL